ncbi:MAG TPA: hypothetical protein VNB64_08905 [Solirubrobacteraceae bacterium]|nr:hypothetical protein [Solirubrobacteraceae bacterium]
MLRRPLRFALAGALLAPLAAGAGAATAQAPGVSVQLQPDVAGRASSLVVAADGRARPVAGRVPSSAVLSVQRGFRVDPRSRAARCSSRQAQDFACPEASRIGSGQAVVTARGLLVPGGAQQFTASIALFIAPPVPSADVAGVVVAVSEPSTGRRATATGRIVRRARGPYGYELRFDRFPAAQPPPPGVEIELERLDLRVGARRTVTVYRTIGSGTSRRRVRRRVVRSLIANPSACYGSWTARAALSFPDGSSLQSDLSTPCRRS